MANHLTIHKKMVFSDLSAPYLFLIAEYLDWAELCHFSESYHLDHLMKDLTLKNWLWRSIFNHYFKTYPASINTSENNAYQLSFFSQFREIQDRLQEDGLRLRCLSPAFQNDETTVLTAIKDGFAMQYAAKDLRANKAFMLKAVQYNGLVIRYIDESLQDDTEIATAAVIQNANAIRHASAAIKSNRAIAALSLTKEGGNFRFLCTSLRNDETLLRMAINSSRDTAFVLQSASTALKANQSLMIDMMAKNPYLLGLLEHFQDDEDVVSAAIEKSGGALKFASSRLRNTREIVFKAIQEDPMAIQFASKTLKDDEKLVLTAMSLNDLAFQHASERLKSKKQIVLFAVTFHGYFLSHTTATLQNDREVVLKAVAHRGSALRYASPRLKNDYRVVETAVKNDGDALAFASTRLKDTKKIVKLAIQKSGDTLEHASARLKADRALQTLSKQRLAAEEKAHQEGMREWRAMRPDGVRITGAGRRVHFTLNAEQDYSMLRSSPRP